MRCSRFPRDSTLLGMLRIHIPMPDAIRAMGVQERDFYNQLRIYWNTQQAAFKPFNGEAMAADLDAKMIKPLRETQALFDKHRKLTRLATFISPEEMTVDPTFVMNPSLPDIPAFRNARAIRVCGDQKYTACEAPVRIDLPSGRAGLVPPEAGQATAGRPNTSGANWTLCRRCTRATPAPPTAPGVARYDNAR